MLFKALFNGLKLRIYKTYRWTTFSNATNEKIFAVKISDMTRLDAGQFLIQRYLFARTNCRTMKFMPKDHVNFL